MHHVQIATLEVFNTKSVNTGSTASGAQITKTLHCFKAKVVSTPNSFLRQKLAMKIHEACTHECLQYAELYWSCVQRPLWSAMPYWSSTQELHCRTLWDTWITHVRKAQFFHDRAFSSHRKPHIFRFLHSWKLTEREASLIPYHDVTMKRNEIHPVRWKLPLRNHYKTRDFQILAFRNASEMQLYNDPAFRIWCKKRQFGDPAFRNARNTRGLMDLAPRIIEKCNALPIFHSRLIKKCNISRHQHSEILKSLLALHA